VLAFQDWPMLTCRSCSIHIVETDTYPTLCSFLLYELLPREEFIALHGNCNLFF
jgi:hypothetical protein